MEDAGVNESWNKKRIFAAVFLLALLIAGVYIVKTRVLGLESPSQESMSVKGVSTKEDNNKEEEKKEDLKINIQESVKEKINALKQEVSGLNVLEVASSSPQIQKIINDIKSIEQYPVNQAKEICRQICGL